MLQLKIPDGTVSLNDVPPDIQPESQYEIDNYWATQSKKRRIDKVQSDSIWIDAKLFSKVGTNTKGSGLYERF